MRDAGRLSYPLALPRTEGAESESQMPHAETWILRASLSATVYRDIEVDGKSSLFALAEAITRAFNFDFDHAFGFYDSLKGNIYQSAVRYELFVDMEETGSEARSVKRTPVAVAFPSVGKKMRFLFDYGDEWIFFVECVKQQAKKPKVELPRVLISAGKAPEQYPDPDDE